MRNRYKSVQTCVLALTSFSRMYTTRPWRALTSDHHLACSHPHRLQVRTRGFSRYRDLTVEMDAQYLRGMLANPNNIQPSAAINRGSRLSNSSTSNSSTYPPRDIKGLAVFRRPKSGWMTTFRSANGSTRRHMGRTTKILQATEGVSTSCDVLTLPPSTDRARVLDDELPTRPCPQPTHLSLLRANPSPERSSLATASDSTAHSEELALAVLPIDD